MKQKTIKLWVYDIAPGPNSSTVETFDKEVNKFIDGHNVFSISYAHSFEDDGIMYIAHILYYPSPTAYDASEKTYVPEFLDIAERDYAEDLQLQNELRNQ